MRMSMFLQGIEGLVRLHDTLARERIVEEDRLARERNVVGDQMIRDRLKEVGAPEGPAAEPSPRFVEKLRALDFNVVDDCLDECQPGDLHFHPVVDDPAHAANEDCCPRCAAVAALLTEGVPLGKPSEHRQPTQVNELGHVCPACGLVLEENPERLHEGVIGLIFVEGCDLLATLSIFEGDGDESRLTRAMRHALSKEEAALTRRLTTIRTLLSGLPGSSGKSGTVVAMTPRPEKSSAAPPDDASPDDPPSAA